MGDLVGLRVEGGVCVPVRDSVGLCVGVPVGDLVGLRVGGGVDLFGLPFLPLGVSVGDSVGLRVEVPVGDSVGLRVEGLVPVEGSVGLRVGGRVDLFDLPLFNFLPLPRLFLSFL